MHKEPSLPLFHRNKPIFGIDIGFSSIKVMQIDTNSKKSQIKGYGFCTFDSSSMKNGVIVEPEAIAKSIYDLFSNNLVGTIDTKKVISSVPVGRSFNRILTLPALNKSDLDEAVKLEAEQYIPVSIDDLYIDYIVSDRTRS